MVRINTERCAGVKRSLRGLSVVSVIVSASRADRPMLPWRVRDGAASASHPTIVR